MTTLCIEDLAPNVLSESFDERAKAKAAAGRATYERALALGYCNNTARALQRTASREWVRGETPEQTARRIVQLPPASATLPPKGAA